LLGRRSTRSLWGRLLFIDMQEGEFIIFHTYSASAETPKKLPEERIRRKGENLLAKMLSGAALAAGLLGVILLIVSYAPSVWFWAKNGIGVKVSQILEKPVATSGRAFETANVGDWQPSFDTKLPLESRIKITALGVDTQIQEATADNIEGALKKGVWRVSDFGTPADRSYPTILAAHRYGYLVWTNTFRRKNSFYNLPKLKVGDTVTVIWKQRKYVYEIYAESRGGEIVDYNGDLILYTCETLGSSERIFKYGRLLRI